MCALQPQRCTSLKNELGVGAQGTTASCELGYSLYWVAGRTDPKHLHLDKGK